MDKKQRLNRPEDETRYFVKYRPLASLTSDPFSYMIVHGYPSFEWPADNSRGTVVYKHAIPREFWGLSFDEYEGYFERGVKPVLRYRAG